MAQYGAPYSGSKSQLAEAIIDFIPPHKRFVDLFGGGGAMTHCACTYGKNKFKTVLYNELAPLVVEYFQNAVNGVYNMDKHVPRVIDRDTFFQECDHDMMVANIWSFGNDGKSYCYGKHIEELKLKAFEMLTRATVSERYTAYRNFIRYAKKQIEDIYRPEELQSYENLKNLESLERLERLQSLQNLKRLQSLERLERLEITNQSYTEYKYQDGDVVYCDIPYETGAKHGQYMHKGFDFQKFYDWAFEADFPVYFSSYEISDDRFKSELIKIKTSTLSVHNNVKVNEFIYMNQKAYEQQCESRLFEVFDL